MKTILIFILSALSVMGAEVLTTKRDAGVISYPATTLVNSAIFETDGSGNVVMTPTSVYATSASLSSYLTTATAASTYAPVSTTVTLGTGQTITGNKLFENLRIKSGSYFGTIRDDGTNLTTNRTYYPPNGEGYLALTANVNGIPQAPISQVTGLGTGVAAALAINADATGGIFRQGQALSATTVTASGAVACAAGSIGAPSINFGDATTGLYKSASNRFAFVAGGSSIATVYSSGVYLDSGKGLGLSGTLWLREGASGVAYITSTATGSTLRDLNLAHLTASGTVTFVPAASATPANNGDLTFERTSNTSLTIKLRGTDGTVRSAVLTLAP